MAFETNSIWTQARSAPSFRALRVPVRDRLKWPSLREKISSVQTLGRAGLGVRAAFGGKSNTSPENSPEC